MRHRGHPAAAAMTPETKPLLGDESSSPSANKRLNIAAHFTSALPLTTATTTTRGGGGGGGHHLPQAIAHRGFRAQYPENTLLAFRAALDEAGAHALETDLHLSRDGVVVLSHDGSLKRCFGIEDKKINECDWSYLKTLETVREPRQRMPRLEDLLGLLAEEGREGVWVLLDIKTDDPPAELLGRVADVLASTPGPVPWNERIVFGCWNQPYITHVRTILPAYPISLISWSPLYARNFLTPKQPNLSFNMFQKSLVGPVGKLFIRDVKKNHRQLFVWTVNDEEWMEWSIRAGADGVITDDPELFREVCKRWEGASTSTSTSTSVPSGEREVDADEKARAARRTGRVRDGTWKRTARLYLEVAGIQVLVAVFTPILMLVARFGVVGPGPKAAKALKL
ncbi:glycerophosphoryl diester phosphodiesterase [Colletotrichum costaricense]|uniref:Glycerophosphoryl diester phosphodiesterase n=1 Tax=Colletotrichum costaricense TaxID=1209916 RepID=A0AAJ0E3F7_9PEZI|nr:glycerophosphoryl diester phosphodiesterase [Colletotrichum costaricense]KAK1530877.1 glycerophosphoryl diester phosphodiesterase [Colletotrichum costaricense]